MVGEPFTTLQSRMNGLGEYVPAVPLRKLIYLNTICTVGQLAIDFRLKSGSLNLSSMNNA